MFHAALPGSSADNDRWASRKGRIAWHFGLPSLEVWRRYVGDDGDPMAFLTAFALPVDKYFPAGGAVPITVGASFFFAASGGGVQWGVASAVMIVGALPPMLLGLLMYRQISGSMTAGAVKG